MKSFLFKFALLTFLNCSLLSQTFEEVKTPFKCVNNIKFFGNNKLFVSGDSIGIDLYSYSPFIPYMGSGFYLSDNFGKSFSGPYLEGKTVFDIVVSEKNPKNVFCSAIQFTRGRIYKSNDGANTWDLTSMHEDVKIYQKMISTKSPDNKETILITSPNSIDGLSLTSDEFQTLTISPLVNTQVFDIKFSKELDSYFFATENSNVGHVARLSSKGIQGDITGLEGLRILCVQPSKLQPGYVYCGADSITSQKISIGKGIFYSIDTGKTWKHMTADGYQVFEILEHPTDPNFLAAACGKVGVGVSGNYGKWFDTFSDGLPENYDIRRIAIPNVSPNGSGIQIFASSLNQGLFKSKNITSPVNEHKDDFDLKIERIFPNPIVDQNFSVEIILPFSSEIIVSIVDLFGNILIKEEFNSFKSGTNIITFEDHKINPGHYLLLVSNNKSQIVKPLIIIK